MRKSVDQERHNNLAHISKEIVSPDKNSHKNIPKPPLRQPQSI